MENNLLSYIFMEEVFQEVLVYCVYDDKVSLCVIGVLYDIFLYVGVFNFY